MMRSGKTQLSQWLIIALFVVICGMCRETVIGNLFQPVARQPRRLEKLPREVLVIQQAVKKQIARKTNNPLLNRIQREHVGTDVLAYQLPTRMRPTVVHRTGGAMWRLSTWTAHKVGQVPVMVVLGDANVAAEPACGGQLFVVGLCDPRIPDRTRICMMLTTSIPLANGDS
ncbi:MAG: hypothetical protein VYA32_11700 [Planctomycetota bacterium]|nr:hypothetical protein [Planctomycetota bacterium]MED5399444.1 hypothetical protein [Planctomycetota bacterium]